MRAVRGLVPYALMHESVFLGKPASERDDLGEGKFDHAARVRERSVEDRDAALRGGFEIDLVGADAERANGDEVRCRLEYPPRDVRLRSDAEDGHVLRGPYQFRLVVSPIDVPVDRRARFYCPAREVVCQTRSLRNRAAISEREVGRRER